jgi:hypothetical protein
MFVRTKWIKGNPYAYLVENEWGKRGSRQSVTEYLGRIVTQELQPTPTLPTDTPPEEIILSLVQQELRGLKDIAVDLQKGTVKRKGRNAVISLNGGYLCEHTLKDLRLARYEKNEERPGTALAEAFSRAGLRIPQHAFITLYRWYNS